MPMARDGEELIMFAATAMWLAIDKDNSNGTATGNDAEPIGILGYS